jgi:arginine utilization protein RocB
MDLKVKIKKVLREHYGEFETYLENRYEEILTENLIKGNKKTKEAWVTYNQIVLELKNSLKNNLKVKELQYKLTDELNPKDVCIEVITEIKDLSPELKRLYNKVKNYY